LESFHPFLGNLDHRLIVIDLVKKFAYNNFKINTDFIRIGHLFFGKKAFSISGRDIGIIYSDKTKYYLTNFDYPINTGLSILVDEASNNYNLIIAEVSKDDIGCFFENVMINIIIKKEKIKDYSCLIKQDYSLELFRINNYGTLTEVGSHEFEYIANNCSKLIRQLFIFNLEKFR